MLIKNFEPELVSNLQGSNIGSQDTGGLLMNPAQTCLYISIYLAVRLSQRV